MESSLVQSTGIHIHTVAIVSSSLGQSLIMLGERKRERKERG